MWFQGHPGHHTTASGECNSYLRFILIVHTNLFSGEIIYKMLLCPFYIVMLIKVLNNGGIQGKIENSLSGATCTCQINYFQRKIFCAPDGRLRESWFCRIWVEVWSAAARRKRRRTDPTLKTTRFPAINAVCKSIFSQPATRANRNTLVATDGCIKTENNFPIWNKRFALLNK